MEPGVPFPLLAGVELFCAAAALGLAGVACSPRLRFSRSPLLVAGALMLVAGEALTAVPAAGSSTALLWIRAVGFTLIGLGLWPGDSWSPDESPRAARNRGSPRTGSPAGAPGPGTGASLAVVVPLGGSVSSATVATAAGLGAALVALRLARNGPPARRLPAVLLAGGLSLLAVACALTPLAATSPWAALGVVALRALGALTLIGLFAVLARHSVLGKIAGAIVAGVLGVSICAVAVMGTVVASSFAQAQAEQAEDVASGRLQSLRSDLGQVQRAAELVTRCRTGELSCNDVLLLAEPDEAPLVALVLADGRVRRLNGPPLSEGAATELAAQALVRETVEAPDDVPVREHGDLVRLAESHDGVGLLGVAPVPGDPTPAEPRAGLWFVPLDDQVLEAGAHLTGGFDLSVLIDGEVVSSSLEPDEAAELEGAVRESFAPAPPVARFEGRTLLASGQAPLVHVTPLPLSDTGDVAVLAVSRDAAAVLAAEDTALTRMLVVALGLTLALAVTGVLVGRQLVKPVDALTAAAVRVSGGDLKARSDVSGHDELGTLGRAFDTMTSALSDLTSDLRASAEQEIRLRNHLETVLRSLADGVLVTDGCDVVTRFNPAALAILGLDEPQVLGRPLWAVPALRDLDRPLTGYGEGEIARADGTVVPVAIAATSLPAGGGRVLVIRDLTRERDLERMKTEFLSNVSHELRTPLTPIRGYAELLLRKPGLTAEQSASFAAAILDACLRLTKVVDLLVDVAALEAGRVVPELRSVAADGLLLDRLQEWRARRARHADDLRLAVDEGLPRLSVDPFWLGRALDELIDNALKHTPPGTPVLLAAEARPDGWVSLSVRDAGPGIPSGIEGKVLREFEQADGSSTREAGGLGLGLALVRRLCEGFGLTMRLESAPGAGTEIALLVPAERTSGLVRWPDRSSSAKGWDVAQRV